MDISSGLVILDFGKANIVSIQTRNYNLPGTNLFSIFRHKVVSFVQVFKRGAPVDLSVRCYTEIIQQLNSLFHVIKEHMQLATGIHHLVGDQVIRLVIELFFADHIVPFGLAVFVKGHDHDIICLVPDIISHIAKS